MNKFLIVVVIYELELKQSVTLNQLVEFAKINAEFSDVLIFDNSINPHSLGHEFGMFAYRHDPSNSGVAGAYNYALAFGEKLNKEWLIFFDQDTYIDKVYFEALNSSLSKFPDQKLFCPIVRSNNIIVSPTYYFAEKAFSFKNLKQGLCKCKYYTLINSGIVIKRRELEQLKGYDPLLPLDYSDHYFFDKFKKRNQYFVIMETEILHHLSSHSDEIFETVYKRFKSYRSSTIIYAKRVNSIFPLVWLVLRAFKLTFKFSNPVFLKALIFKR